MFSNLLSSGTLGVMLGYAAAFLAGVVSTIVLALLGRAAFGAFRPLGRVLRAALRFLGLKSAARSRPVRAALTGATAHRRADHLTAIECALRSHETAEGGDAGECDFAEERRILKKYGQVFTWLRIPSEYIPASLSQPFSDAVANEYLGSAQKFFSRSVDLHSDEHNLYEDEEGAVIVSLFRDADRRCFYALDQLRRVINGNAFRLILGVSLFTLLATAAVYVAASRFLPKGTPAASDGLVTMLGSGFAVFAGYAFFAHFLQVFYRNDQRQNMREFSDFLTRYLSLVSNRFRESSAAASRVIQGDERDSKRLAANAQKWHKIMIWLGLRPFFLESFVRNVIFQIRRNSKYYVAGALLLFAVFGPAIFVAASIFLGAGQSEAAAGGSLAGLVMAGPSLAGWVAVGVAYAACAAFGVLVINRPVIFDELNQTNWLGYDNLEVGRQMDEVIGKFAEEIGLWRGRFRE